jgi:hypothetical protein
VGWKYGLVDIEAELSRLLGSLAREDGVFSRVASMGEGSVAEQVRQLAVKAERVWGYAMPGASGPDSPAEVAGALSEIDRERAVDLMTYLSADDLVFPGRSHRDRAHAHRAADRVVKLLGYESTWCTNIGDLSAGVRAWMPVTRHTFDGVVAGQGSGFVVVLLQVGED